MSTDNIIKIAIADDHKIFRDGIKMALSGKANLKMLWEAEDGKDMMHKISIKKPDVLLMDIRMPEIDGINAIQILRKEYEGLICNGYSRRSLTVGPARAFCSSGW